MSTENKLRKFKLIDEDGYKASHHLNYVLLRQHLKNNCLEGIIDDGHLFYSKDLHNALITRNEFQFFEEVFEEESGEGVNLLAPFFEKQLKEGVYGKEKPFPQIGDRATYGGNKNCEVVGVHNNTCMLLAERGDYHLADISDISEYKPLTEDEIIIRSKVKNIIQRYTLETALDYLMEEYTVIEKDCYK